MHKLLVIVMVTGAGFGFYRFNNGDVSSPVNTYREFMTHLRATEIDDATRMAHGDRAAEDIRAFRKHEAGRFQVRGSMSIHRTIFRVDSSYEDGDVTVLDIVEELRCDPPGAHTQMGTVNIWLRHEVEMKQVGGEWKVLAFSSEFESAEAVGAIDVDNAHRWF